MFLSLFFCWFGGFEGILVGNRLVAHALCFGALSEKGRGKKRKEKKADWILANSVLQSNTPVFNSDRNEIFFITETETQRWGADSKISIAQKLTSKINDYFFHVQQKEVT